MPDFLHFVLNPNKINKTLKNLFYLVIKVDAKWHRFFHIFSPLKLFILPRLNMYTLPAPMIPIELIVIIFFVQIANNLAVVSILLVPQPKRQLSQSHELRGKKTLKKILLPQKLCYKIPFIKQPEASIFSVLWQIT